MAHSKHEEVRHRFGSACGYCGVSETDTGGQLTVDHFVPLSAGGGDNDENLVYACFRCNLYKGDFFPTEEQRNQGIRVLHPLLDDQSAHFREEPSTCLLVPVTDTGRFHIRLLQLNRPELVFHRRRERILALEAQQAELREARIAMLQHQIATLERSIELLRQLLEKE
ncbi:MAG: hypothetical protein OHK0029_33040 [Armatimonadaceae bacterium]